MTREGADAVWPTRLRWRLRGAWLWPAFAALTAADALLLSRQPLAGTHTSFPSGLLLSMFFNIVVLALVAPLVGRRLRARRPDLPRVVADDRAGTALLLVVFAGLAIGGLAHRPGRLAAQRAFAAQSAAVRRYVAHNAPAAYRARVDAADTWRQAEGLYRTCVPGPKGAPPLCLLVNTDQSPPGVRVDSDRTPNGSYVGPRSAAHHRG